MEPVTTGRRSVMMNSLGCTLAAGTRDGTAPNLRETDLCPPDMVPQPRRDGKTAPDGRPLLQYGDRFRGGNSIALRLDVRERGVSDSRYGTEPRTRSLNELSGCTAPAVRSANALTGLPPSPVELASSLVYPVQVVHEADGKGYRENGSFSDVKAGDPVRSASGDLVSNTYERNATYQAYHVTDLNLPELPDRARLGMGPSAVARQDGEFAFQCEQRGEPVRQPTTEERVGMIATAGVRQRLAEQGDRLVVVEDCRDVDGARFSVQSGTACLEIAPASHFEDVHDQVTSVMQACAHANLYFALKARVETAGRAGDVDPAAVAGVAAYEAPLDSRSDSPEMLRAELVTTYAAVNLTTELRATYVPPPSTRNEASRQRWAELLEQPGAMASLSRDIADAETGPRRKAPGPPPRERSLSREPGDPGGGPPREEPAERRPAERRLELPPLRPASVRRQPGVPAPGGDPSSPAPGLPEREWRAPGYPATPVPGDYLPRRKPVVLPAVPREQDAPGRVRKPLKVGGDKDVPLPPARGTEPAPKPSPARVPTKTDRPADRPAPGGRSR